MAAKVVSLAVHKNTVEGRRKRTLAATMAANVAKLCREEDIRAIAVVGIASDGRAFALWDTGGIMPMRAFPHVVAEALSDDIHNADMADDWCPSLPLKGSTQWP